MKNFFRLLGRSNNAVLVKILFFAITDDHF